MNRRAFLAFATAGAAGMVLDPERLLWVPGQRSYVFLEPALKQPSFGELVAIVYEQVLRERQKDGQLFWNDSAMIRQFARDAVNRV